MDLWTLTITIACGIAVTQSFFLSTYLFFKNRKISTPLFFLSIILLALALRIGKSYFYYVFASYFEIGKILGALGVWTIGPSFLLYTLASKPTIITGKDYLHYIPSLLIICFAWAMMESLAPLYFWGAFSFLAYFVASLLVFFYQDWNGNKKRFTLFATSLAIICSCFLMQALTNSVQTYAFGSLVVLVVLYIINFLILKDQSYLKTPALKTKKVNVSQQNKIINALEKSFKQNKIYRQKGLTLASVSEAINYPTYQVSKTINQHFGIKFNDYVNQYRIKETKERLHDLDTNDKIEVIAKEVGFSSTSSLYTAFKKEEKVTPQVFRKQVKA